MPSPEHSDRPPVGHLPPADLRVDLDPSARLLPGADGDLVLVGGSPLRLLRLRPAALAVLERLRAGSDVGDGAQVGRFVRRLLDAGVVHPRVDRAVPGAPAAADCTVVIPVHDRAEPLGRLLRSITEHTPGLARIVVVDDGSSDGTGEVARDAGATVIRRDAPGGPAAARNAGLAAVDTAVVAFLDSDCTVTAGWIEPLLAHLADPAVGLVAPRIVGHDGPAGGSRLEQAVAHHEAVRSSLDLGPSPAPVAPTTRVAYLPAAALLARTEVLRGIGGFDESMPVGEDVDLVWRLVESGERVRYEPSARVRHDHRLRLGDFLLRRMQYGTSAAALHRRHPGSVPPIVVSPWSLAAWIGVATMPPLGMVAGIGIAAGSTAALPAKLGALAEPWPESIRLAGRGHWATGRQLAAALWRTYLPVALVGALVSARARRALVAAAVLPALTDLRRLRPGGNPLAFVALRTLDDAAYCTGVWIGCLRERTIGPLVPVVADWPGRRPAAEDAGR